MFVWVVKRNLYILQDNRGKYQNDSRKGKTLIDWKYDLNFSGEIFLRYLNLYGREETFQIYSIY